MRRPAALSILLTLVLLFGCNGQEAQPVATATGAVLQATEMPAATSTTTNTPAPSFPTVTNTAINTPAAASTSTPTTTPTHTPTPQPPTATPTVTSTPPPARETGRVTQVIDGGTIGVLINDQAYRVHYIGMNTPETDEYGFQRATDANRRLVEGQTVYLEKDVSETDRSGRLLRCVYLEDGTFVNAELVRQGFAQVATYSPDVKHQDLFVQLQGEAREAGRGLWGLAPTQLPPATAMPVPQPTATATQAAQQPGQVVIQTVFYDGAVPRVESDEYAVIANVGGMPVNIGGWRLNAGDQGQDFVFPSFELQPGQACRVYTNEVHPESCGFSFGSGRAIWNNKGDCGYLYDGSGVEVGRYCY